MIDENITLQDWRPINFISIFCVLLMVGFAIYNFNRADTFGIILGIFDLLIAGLNIFAIVFSLRTMRTHRVLIHKWEQDEKKRKAQ